jgi:hypothetical protein
MQFPIFGCASSLLLELRRWQEQYCFCQGDECIRHHHSWRSTSTGPLGLARLVIVEIALVILMIVVVVTTAMLTVA